MSHLRVFTFAFASASNGSVPILVGMDSMCPFAIYSVLSAILGSDGGLPPAVAALVPPPELEMISVADYLK